MTHGRYSITIYLVEIGKISQFVLSNYNSPYSKIRKEEQAFWNSNMLPTSPLTQQLVDVSHILWARVIKNNKK